MSNPSSLDERFMLSCIGYARWHSGLTGMNPSVGCLVVRDGCIVGRGVTGLGGIPHAERVALDEAGDLSVGSTLYVSLEPCSHHGRTPPCSELIVERGIARVVSSLTDPDSRVSGRGYSLLESSGIEVITSCYDSIVRFDLCGYLSSKLLNRPHITLKLAVTSDGFLGVRGERTEITGEISRSYSHRLRADSDGIVIGRCTVESDSPELTCRLPGLFERSPTPYILTSSSSFLESKKNKLFSRAILVSDISDLLSRMTSAGHNRLLVEGGAIVASSFLDLDLVDRLVIFTSPLELSGDCIISPVTLANIPSSFSLVSELFFGDDTMSIFERRV